MSAVKVIRYLLANNAGLTAVVPATKITAGVVPQATAMPAISVTHISSTWNSEITAQGKYCSSRVQVTAMATTYAQQKQIMALIRTAIPRTGGTINGVSVDCILREMDGPDFCDEDAGIFMQAQDYQVRFNE